MKLGYSGADFSKYRYKPMLHINFPSSILLIFICGLGSSCHGQSANIIPLKQAHAHNDYLQSNPLTDALDAGFCSVESDIFLSDGELLVGHYRWTLKKSRTLKKLYLEPLMKQVERNNGRVYRDGPLFTLLIDIKENGTGVYPELKKQLLEFESMLCGLRNGQYEYRAIQVVISGSCPRKLIEADTQRLVAIDGRLSDLDSKAPANLIPMISARWGSTFKWRGRSEIDDAELAKLKSIVHSSHQMQRRVRLWASPESTAVWQQLLDVGIDHINTDNLKKLQSFLLLKHQPEK